MADFSLPTTSSLYTDFVAELKGRDDSIATMFRSGTDTNVPANAIRWEPTNRRFEIYDGVSAWSALEANYNISADKLGGKTAASFLNTADDFTKSAGSTTFSGSATPVLLKGGTADRVYLPFYADAAAQATRSGYIGYGTAANSAIHVVNEILDGNMKLSTNSTTPGLGRVNINDRIYFDGGHGVESAASDILITGSGVIATQESMYFNIDSDNNSTATKFYWGNNTETSTANSLMTLDEAGRLGLNGYGVITADTTSALYLNQTGNAYHIHLRDGVNERWNIGAPNTEDHFKIYSYGTSSVAFQIDYGNNNLTSILGYKLQLGKAGVGDSYLDFWDDNSATYRSLYWHNVNNQFQLELNDGSTHKILTEADRNFSIVANATSVGAGTSGYWFKIADITIPNENSELNLTLDVSGASYNGYGRFSVFLRNVNGGASATACVIRSLYVSDRNVGAISNGNLRAIQTGTAPTGGSSPATFELWFQVGTSYFPAQVQEVMKVATTGITVTYAGATALTATEPVSAFGINIDTKWAAVTKDDALYLGNQFSTPPKVWDGTSAFYDALHTGGGQTVTNSVSISGANPILSLQDNNNTNFTDSQGQILATDSVGATMWRVGALDATANLTITTDNGNSNIVLSPSGSGTVKWGSNDLVHIGGGQVINGTTADFRVGAYPSAIGSTDTGANSCVFEFYHLDGITRDGYVGHSGSGEMRFYNDAASTYLGLPDAGGATYFDGASVRNLIHSGGGTMTGDLTVNAIRVTAASTLEGGQIDFARPTGTAGTGLFSFDVYSSNFRMFADVGSGTQVLSFPFPASGSASILHTGGGQTITGVNTFNGVKFPSTQVPSADANTLDDYEEGTWSPELWDSSFSGAEGQTYALNNGSYTKIGNIVFITGDINMSSLGTLSTTQQARIGNLPFDGNLTSGRYGTISFGFITSTTLGSNECVYGYVYGTSIPLFRSLSGNSSNLNVGVITSAGGIRFSGMYFV